MELLGVGLLDLKHIPSSVICMARAELRIRIEEAREQD